MSEQALVPQQQQSEIDLFDRENPRSLANILPKAIAEKLLGAKEKRPDLFQMDEDELLECFKQEKLIPTSTDSRLRMNLWNEYERAQTLKRSIFPTNIYLGVCTAPHFYQVVLRRPEKVAWLFTPPADYATSLHEALLFSLAEMRRALSLPHVKGNKVDTRLLEVKVKIYEKIEARALGAIPQKILNLHGQVPVKESEAKTVEDLENELNELKKRNRLAPIDEQGRNSPESD